MDHGDMPMPMAPDSMDNNNSSMYGNDMAMHMSFYWGKDITFLFNGWPNDHLYGYFLALIFVFLLALVLEVLSFFPPMIKAGAGWPAVISLSHVAVYAVRMALAYMVMLSVMSFNLGMFIVAVAGHTLGYFLVKLRDTRAALRPNGGGSTTSEEYPKV